MRSVVDPEWLRPRCGWENILIASERARPEDVEEFVELVRDALWRMCPHETEPSPIDRLTATTIAAAMWRCRRLGDNGLATDQDRQGLANQKKFLESDRRRAVLQETAERAAAYQGELDAVRRILEIRELAGLPAVDVGKVLQFKPRKVAGKAS